MKRIVFALTVFMLSCMGTLAQPYSGNPILMGYHADPEVMYSHLTDRYYIYSTSENNTIR